MLRSNGSRPVRWCAVALVCLVTSRAHAQFLRGDANDDGRVDISDPRATLDYLFLGADEPICLAALDANDDERVDISDAIAELEFLFLGGPPPRPPFPTAGFDPTPGLACGLIANEAPSVSILAPASGTTVRASSVRLRVRVNDEVGIVRVVVDGVDLAIDGPLLAAEGQLPATLESTLSAGPEDGPRLVRVEVVDTFGRASFAERAFGFDPILARGASTAAASLSFSGTSGYDELENIVEPFLATVPQIINQAASGVRLFDSNIAGVRITVTGNRAEIDGTPRFELLPSDANGGRILLRASIDRIRFFADGRSDFGFLGTDSWTAVWTGNAITIEGLIAFAPRPGGGGLAVVSDGFTTTIGSSSFSVSGFLDPLGIFDAVVGALSPLFADTIESAVADAVADAAENEILPALETALGAFDLDLDLGTARLDTSIADAIESSRGLALQLGGAWTGDRSPSAPDFPGTHARRAPYPEDVTAPVSHAVDATLCLSVDSLEQALDVLLFGGSLRSETDLGDLAGPIPLTAGTFATLLEPKLLTLDGVDGSDGLGLILEPRAAPRLRVGVGGRGVPLVGQGERWRTFRGTSAPPANWTAASFNDASWTEAPSGFGYSSNALELERVATTLDDMPNGYVSFHARRAFDVANPAALAGLLLRVEYDDGFVAYLNGVEVGRRGLGAPGSAVSFDTLADSAIEPDLAEIDVLATPGVLRTGRNVLAIEGHNANPTSSDFILVPELIAAAPRPAGTFASLPVRIEIDDLELAIVADTDDDGVGAGDADGERDETELFAYSIGLALDAEILLRRAADGSIELLFAFESGDGPDADTFPDALVGGPAGLRIAVAREAFDIDDADLVELAQVLLSVFSGSLGEALAILELPSLVVPELAFDLDGDGNPDTTLSVERATLTPAETTGDADPDWICVLLDLVRR